MFEDRLEISSPGGMFGGVPIQEQHIDQIKSDRRNPIIADLFHRMKYMERRGSGLKKVLNETKKLSGYTEDKKPVFYSTPTSFTAILKNVNYQEEIETHQERVKEQILLFCGTARSKREIADYTGYKDLRNLTSRYLKPLLEEGKLRMTMPQSPRHRNQKYVKNN